MVDNKWARLRRPVDVSVGQVAIVTLLRDAFIRRGIVNPRTAKTGLLILTAIIIGVVVIFFRKPDEPTTVAKKNTDQPLVLRRDVVESPTTTAKVASHITEAAKLSESNTSAADDSAFSSKNPAASAPELDVPKLEPVDVGPIDVPAATSSSGFVPPSVSVLPPETAHGEPPVLEKLVNVPPLPTVNGDNKTVLTDVASIGQETNVADVAAAATNRQAKQTVLKQIGPPRYHRIVDGDTLEKISMHYFGTESRAKDLFEMNRSLLERPDLLPLRKHLLIPPETREYVVDQAATKPKVSGESGSGTIRETTPTPTTTPMPEAVLSPIPDGAREGIQSQTELVPVP
ncbi:MAG: hypothetical protein AAF497_17565 [Planctomycetota bacterium]